MNHKSLQTAQFHSRKVDVSVSNANPGWEHDDKDLDTSRKTWWWPNDKQDGYLQFDVVCKLKIAALDGLKTSTTKIPEFKTAANPNWIIYLKGFIFIFIGFSLKQCC